MTKNLDKEGFSSIVDNYQLFYVDLWGVIHNGIHLHKDLCHYEHHPINLSKIDHNYGLSN